MNIHKINTVRTNKIILNDHLLMIKKKNDAPTRTEVIRESTSGRDWAGMEARLLRMISLCHSTLQSYKYFAYA